MGGGVWESKSQSEAREIGGEMREGQLSHFHTATLPHTSTLSHNVTSVAEKGVAEIGDSLVLQKGTFEYTHGDIGLGIHMPGVVVIEYARVRLEGLRPHGGVPSVDTPHHTNRESQRARQRDCWRS